MRRRTAVAFRGHWLQPLWRVDVIESSHSGGGCSWLRSLRHVARCGGCWGWERLLAWAGEDDLDVAGGDSW